MKNRAGPAMVLFLPGPSARVAQATPTLGLSGVGPWLLQQATCLRPEFHFLMTAISDSLFLRHGGHRRTQHSNSPGFGGTGRQDRQASRRAYGQAGLSLITKQLLTLPWASVPRSGPGLVQQGDENLQSRQEVHTHRHTKPTQYQRTNMT